MKEENKKQFIYEITHAISYDFILETLRFGNEVKVLQPLLLVNRIKIMHKKVFEQYESKLIQ